MMIGRIPRTHGSTRTRPLLDDPDRWPVEHFKRFFGSVPWPWIPGGIDAPARSLQATRAGGGMPDIGLDPPRLDPPRLDSLQLDSLQLGPQLDAAARSRTFVRAALLSWGLEDLLDPVLLLTSEVVSNALLHAGTDMVVRVQQDGSGVRVDVADGSGVPPVRRRLSSSATTGRGVQLLDNLSDEWGWIPSLQGKSVWFQVLSADAWVAAFDVESLSEVRS